MGDVKSQYMYQTHRVCNREEQSDNILYVGAPP